MRRADRLLLIVQSLRRRRGPSTARQLADELEVVPRTIYRDIAALQAARVPIDGEPGVGYILRSGYDLPPLMFTSDEVEAVVLGARMVIERGDPELGQAAEDVLAKVKAVLPSTASDLLWRATLIVPHPLETGVDFGNHVARIRRAVRDSRKLTIAYRDGAGKMTERTIWPLGLYLYSHVTLVCAWCELRAGYRAFRSDRIEACMPLDERFDPRGGALMHEFLADFSAPTSE